MPHAVHKLRLETLEEIEACGSWLIRQAGHLSKLLALPEEPHTGSFERDEVAQLLTELETLLAPSPADDLANCLAHLRHALGLPTTSATCRRHINTTGNDTKMRTYSPMVGRSTPDPSAAAAGPTRLLSETKPSPTSGVA